MKIAICDDERIFTDIFREKLEMTAEKCGIECTVSAFLNGAEMISMINRFDAVFLDVDMPRLSGEETAEYIIGLEKALPIIFVTNHDDFVFSSFRYRPFGFLRKRYVDSELEDIIKRLDKYLAEIERCYTFNSHNKLISVRLNDINYDINYIEVYGHETLVHTANAVLATSKALSAIEKELSEYGFIRTHKSYIVNTRYIFSVERKSIILSNGENLPVSRTKLTDVKQMMIKFTGAN